MAQSPAARRKRAGHHTFCHGLERRLLLSTTLHDEHDHGDGDVCALPPDWDIASASTAEIEEAPPFPTDQTFLLHSRPAATKVVYLDFDGHTTSGTSWNTSY